MRWLIRLLLHGYRLGVSPLTGPHCRFYPTCSAYALEAFERYGLLQACGVTLRRLARCHPWHPGGYDPLPPEEPPAADRRAESA